MLETLFGISVGISLTDLGVLTAITTIVVQVLKAVLPKKFPTKALTTIVALALTVTLVIIGFGAGVVNIVTGVLAGFIVAFVSMNGFDSLRDIWTRFTLGAASSDNNDTADEEDVETMEYVDGENEVPEEDEMSGEG